MLYPLPFVNFSFRPAALPHKYIILNTIPLLTGKIKIFFQINAKKTKINNYAFLL